MPKRRSKKTARYALKISGKVRRFRTVSSARKAVFAALRRGKTVKRSAGSPPGFVLSLRMDFLGRSRRSKKRHSARRRSRPRRSR
jgi:hypothetical protein